MKPRQIYHILKADLLERTRSYSFLILLGVTLWVGYMFLPSLGSAYTALVICGRRGIYNSAWIGAVFGYVGSLLITMAGFYLVKSSIYRDHQTGVGQIIASTSVSRFSYIMGKWWSNISVLFSIVILLTIEAGILQMILAESTAFNPFQLLLYIWSMTFPVIAIVAALAILFEILPLLRHTFGNAVYFFIALFLVFMGSIQLVYPEQSSFQLDFTGISDTIVSIRHQLVANGIDIAKGSNDLFVPTGGREVSRFIWEGLPWTIGFFLKRMLWFIAAFFITLVSAWLFNWSKMATQFQLNLKPIKTKTSKNIINKQKPKDKEKLKTKNNKQEQQNSQKQQAPPHTETPRYEHLKSAIHLKKRPFLSFLGLLLSEFKLLVKGRRWWWYTTALGLNIAIFFSPLQVSWKYLIPIALLWPIRLWSFMGNREHQYQVYPMVYSANRPILKQVPATWMAGFMIPFITSGSILIRYLMEGKNHHILAWLIGAAFVSSLALALGTISKSPRLFEILYMLFWYLGSINHIPILNYAGLTPNLNTLYTLTTFSQIPVPLLYLGITILLLFLTGFFRSFQIRR
jgi:hypothetical protein